MKARTDHDEAEARLAAMGARGGTNSGALDAAADDVIAADAGLTSLKTALDQRRAALVTQMANLTPNHPQYKQDAAELAQIDANLGSATKQLRADAARRIELKLRSDLERTAGVEVQLNAELGQMTRAAAGATPKLQRAADLAGDIMRLQERYNNIDEQLQNQMIEDAAPGTAHVTTAAVPPAHPVEIGVIRNSLVVLVAFLMLAMLAAVSAQKMDPRLYDASDVEQILGFAPMAQLPDFNEVSGEVGDEHVLRLAAAVEHARRQGDLRLCVVTGTGPGTGTTTIATKLRAVLESMGNPAVLVDAAGAPSAPASPGSAPAEVLRTTRSLAMLEKLNATAGHEGAMIFTDTAPLAVSAETDYLARNVDCVIVVMESAVTTRNQLRATAVALQRLDVGAVGFVLNRVSLSKADPRFRASLRDMETHLRAQSRSESRSPRNRDFGRGYVEDEFDEPPMRKVEAELVTPPQSAAPRSCRSSQTCRTGDGGAVGFRSIGPGPARPGCGVGCSSTRSRFSRLASAACAPVPAAPFNSAAAGGDRDALVAG